MVEVFFDGSSRNGRKGLSAGAGVVVLIDGMRVLELARFVGRKKSNEAEWLALITALKVVSIVQDQLPSAFHLYGDSLVAVNQFNGKWEAKGLYRSFRALSKRIADEIFVCFKVGWIPRELNIADAVAKAAAINERGFINCGLGSLKYGLGGLECLTLQRLR